MGRRTRTRAWEQPPDTALLVFHNQETHLLQIETFKGFLHTWCEPWRCDKTPFSYEAVGLWDYWTRWCKMPTEEMTSRKSQPQARQFCADELKSWLLPAYCLLQACVIDLNEKLKSREEWKAAKYDVNMTVLLNTIESQIKYVKCSPEISFHCFHSKAPNPFPEMVSLRRTALMRCTMISNSEGTVRATAMGRSAQSPTARRRQPPICSKKRRRAKGVSCCKPRNKAVNSLFRNTAKAVGNLHNFQKFDCVWWPYTFMIFWNLSQPHPWRRLVYRSSDRAAWLSVSDMWLPLESPRNDPAHWILSTPQLQIAINNPR